MVAAMALMLPIHHKVRAGLVDTNVISPIRLFEILLLALATILMTCLGCVYRWYSSSQICDILQKFDGIAFIGDESLADAYAGFNILLRENLATGALKDWEMNDVYSGQCRCDSQFTNPSCWLKRISSSEEMFLRGDESGPRNTYACSTRELSTSTRDSYMLALTVLSHRCPPCFCESSWIARLKKLSRESSEAARSLRQPKEACTCDSQCFALDIIFLVHSRE
jgi:hypothetical protein